MVQLQLCSMNNVYTEWKQLKHYHFLRWLDIQKKVLQFSRKWESITNSVANFHYFWMREWIISTIIQITKKSKESKSNIWFWLCKSGWDSIHYFWYKDYVVSNWVTVDTFCTSLTEECTDFYPSINVCVICVKKMSAKIFDKTQQMGKMMNSSVLHLIRLSNKQQSCVVSCIYRYMLYYANFCLLVWPTCSLQCIHNWTLIIATPILKIVFIISPFLGIPFPFKPLWTMNLKNASTFCLTLDNVKIGVELYYFTLIQEWSRWGIKSEYESWKRQIFLPPRAPSIAISSTIFVSFNASLIFLVFFERGSEGQG